MNIFIENYVGSRFAAALDRAAELRTNPITGGRFMPALDPIDVQRRRAEHAVFARLWFAAQKPADAPPLPLTQADREDLKGGGALEYVVSIFARSLADRDYVIAGHPEFDDYACGVMASTLTPHWIRKDAKMLLRFPPKLLPGLGGGLVWRKP